MAGRIISIVAATDDRTNDIVALASLLWPDDDASDLKREFSEVIASDTGVVMIALDGDTPVGFAQCQLRTDYVEGTHSSPVGYLEGIFVGEGYRRGGVARRLVESCQNWAKELGCSEFASDCEIDNIASYRFHKALGFTEANTIVCFVKPLTS